MTAPTLLIGLGGTGTKIVDMVYGMADPATRQNLAVHGFDTDVNDLGKLENLKDHLTQTSDSMTVWQCKNLCRGAVNTWFPDLSNANRGEGPLDRKPLTEGAGQVRVVSRLAYLWTMQNMGLKNLENDVSRLFRVDGATEITTTRVIIVSTLVGGTGAGIFLQTALYLRHLLENTFNQNTVIMRGHFLLPDIFVNTHVTKPDETNDLRSNAYACLKELNGIIRSVRGSGKQRNTIDLEFMPDQENLAVGTVPYDSIFLFDYENTENKSLGTGEEAVKRYLNQAADALFLQLFTPVGESNRSQEDNLIRKTLSEDGLNFFASCGIAKLIYPYEDLLEYCAYKAVRENLEGQWLHIDKMFQREIKSYNRAERGGDFRKKPILSRFYVTQMEDLGGIGSHHPFFTPLYKSTQHLDEQNRPIGSKTDSFLQAIQDKLDTTLAKNKIFQGHLTELKDYPREKALKNKKEIKPEVQQTEDRIFAFRQFILNELIPSTSTPLLYGIMQEDAEAESCMISVDDFRLNTWLLKKTEPMHPLAIRYFLYDLEHKLEDEIKTLETTLKNEKRLIDNYENRFDIKDTTDIQEDAIMRVELALKQGPLQLLLGKNEVKKFADEYLRVSTRMKRTLVSYTRNKIMYDIHNRLSLAIREFSNRWHHFFTDLISEQLDLTAQIRSLEHQHSDNEDPTRKYILNDAGDKEALWEDVRSSQSNNQSSLSSLWNQLYCDMYSSFTREHWNHSRLNDFKRHPRFSLTANLLAWNRKQLSDNAALQVPLIRIMRRTNIDPAPIIQEVRRRSYPWLNRPLGEIRELAYWGIHPDNYNDLTSSEKEVFGGDHCINAENFSPYEIICYVSMYGLTAEELKKFKSRGLQGDRGSHFHAYREKRDELLADPGRHVTHHLDKRWHLDAYLPDLNAEFARIDQTKRKNAFFYGLVYHMLRCYQYDTRQVWRFYGDTLQDIKVHTHHVEEGYHNLFEAFDYNPGLVDDILEYAETTRKEDLKQYGTEMKEHSFIKGCQLNDERTILDAIWLFAREHPGQNLSDEMEEMVVNCIDLIFEYVTLCHGSHQYNRAVSKAKELVEMLQENSSELKEMDQGAREGWLHQIKSRINTYPRQ